MKRIVKLFLLCFLVALLPAQGYVMAAMPACTMTHNENAAGSNAANRISPHCHSASTFHHAYPTIDKTYSVANGTCSSYHHSSHCNGCAACCTGAAATPVVVIFRLPQQSDSLPAAAAAVMFSDMTPVVLERPPQSIQV